MDDLIGGIAYFFLRIIGTFLQAGIIEVFSLIGYLVLSCVTLGRYPGEINRKNRELSFTEEVMVWLVGFLTVVLIGYLTIDYTTAFFI